MDSEMQLGFYFNSNSCIGCKSCVIACKDKNDLPSAASWRRVTEYSGGSWKDENNVLVPSGIAVYYLSIACQHCTSPPCMEVCPASAIWKDNEGIVHVDQDKCVRDQSCLAACPYDAPQFEDDRSKMSKCDMCADLRLQGENPACVDACPLRALDWGYMADLRKKYGSISAVDPMPDGSITNPSIVITPHRHTPLLSHGAGHITDLPETIPAGINSAGRQFIKYSE